MPIINFPRSRYTNPTSTRLPGCVISFALLICLGLFLTDAGAQVTSIPTWRVDATHSTPFTHETILTPSNVNSNTFGKLFSHTLDGNCYTQPLYVSGLSMPDGKVHNVMFVATEHDSVYAFDADNATGANANPLWQVTMLDSAHGAASGATTVPYADVNSSDITPEIGITATPVIDVNKNLIYVTAKTKESGTYVYRLHALSLFDGSEKLGGPVAISASIAGKAPGGSGGVVTFTPLIQHNRPALTLYNGKLYIAFASHGDQGYYHGWIFEYDASNLSQVSFLCTSCAGTGGREGGIWMGGAGMPVDPQGRLFAVTGNGDLQTYPPLTNTTDLGDSVMRIDISNGLKTVDAFTPYNEVSVLNAHDVDQGAGGALILPDNSNWTHPHELVQMGKSGEILILDRDNLGGYNASATSNSYAVQDIPNPASYTISGGSWNTPSYWNGYVYTWGRKDYLTQWQLNGSGTLNTTPVATGSLAANGRPPTTVVSSNGTSNAILWAIYTDNSPEILYAFDATNISKQLYSSATNASRDIAGNKNKFAVPTIANGKVMVGANGQLNVYGLLTTPQTAAPTFSPSAGTYTSTQQVTISSTTPGATIYYTTDGSTPTHSSNIYSGPISVSSSETIKAIASQLGYSDSAVGSAAYTINGTTQQAATPTFSPSAGNYTSAQQVTISTTTANATIYYTTDGSTPTHSSTVYSGPITVSSSETVKAIASASGYTDSSVGSAAYTIIVSNPQAATPTFSPSPGTYNSAQQVTISTTTSNATIYYTTDGSTPTHSSTVYSGPITVSSSETIKAIASAAGYTDSNVGSATYTISTGGGGTVINYGSGFTSGNLQLNGKAALSGNKLRVLPGTTSSKGSAFYTTPVNIQSFTNDFTFQFTSASADGMTFVIQNQSLTALGSDGGSLGYGGTNAITPSVAVKFDFNNNDGEGNDSTGMYTNGARPSVPAIDLTSTGVNLRSSDVMHAHMTYDGATLTVTITDTVTSASATQAYTVNIPSIVGNSTAYVGFTGASGGRTSTQDVLTWTFGN